MSSIPADTAPATAPTKVARFSQHRNAFGFLRLSFAALVILSHTPELIDRDRDRELLTRMFGTISFGDLAVYGFFLISGYLIAGSFIANPHLRPYLVKRVARIYPAFIAASLFCVLVVAPLAGASPADIASSAVGSVKHMLLLQPPFVPHAFGAPAADYLVTSAYDELNGPMWSIKFEFRCYVLVALLGMLGLLGRRKMVAGIAALLLIVTSFVGGMDLLAWTDRMPSALRYATGPLTKAIPLTGVFLVGSSFYLWADRIRFTRAGVAVAIVGLLVSLFSSGFVIAGVALFGGYLIFAVALSTRSGWLTEVNNRNDVSYGVYLYAWPVERLLLWYRPDTSPLLAGMATLLAAYALGWLSWHYLEKPVMRLTRRRRQAALQSA